MLPFKIDGIDERNAFGKLNLFIELISKAETASLSKTSLNRKCIRALHPFKVNAKEKINGIKMYVSVTVCNIKHMKYAIFI